MTTRKMEDNAVFAQNAAVLEHTIAEMVANNKGGMLKWMSLSEEVTVPVSGSPTTKDLTMSIPAGALLFGAAFRVTQAPGGGATTIDLGRKSGGNVDELIDGASCDVLGETGDSAQSRASDTTALPIPVAAADVLMITVDSAVTTTDMKIRVDAYFALLVAPTS